MPSRHQVRKVAVQLLFSTAFEAEGGFKTEQLEAFWDTLLEPQKASLLKMKAKLVDHLTRNLSDSVRLFHTRAQAVLEETSGQPNYDSLRDRLLDHSKREDSLDAAVSAVRSAHKNAHHAGTDDIEARYEELLIINQTLLNLRPVLLTEAKELPQLNYLLHPVIKVTQRLQEISKALDGLQHPGNHPNITEFSSVITAEADLKSLREEAQTLVDKVIAHRDEIDRITDSKIENFSPSRVAPVDRAILRLAVYELMFDKELPIPVIAKEAILLAEEFSTTEAHSFVHGIISGVASEVRSNA
jgi:N utilization substance protein B